MTESQTLLKYQELKPKHHCFKTEPSADSLNSYGMEYIISENTGRGMILYVHIAFYAYTMRLSLSLYLSLSLSLSQKKTKITLAIFYIK